MPFGGPSFAAVPAFDDLDFWGIFGGVFGGDDAPDVETLPHGECGADDHVEAEAGGEEEHHESEDGGHCEHHDFLLFIFGGCGGEELLDDEEGDGEDGEDEVGVWGGEVLYPEDEGGLVEAAGDEDASVEGEEDRHLEEEGEASEGIDLVLLVEFELFLLEGGGVVLVFLLEFLHEWRKFGHAHHGDLAFLSDRPEECADDEGEDDDGESPVSGPLMEDVEDEGHGSSEDFDPTVVDDFGEFSFVSEVLEVSGFFWPHVDVEFEGG